MTECLGFPAEELSHALFTATQALISITGLDGRILSANPALQQFTGRTEDGLIGRPFWEVYVVPEDIERAQAAVDLALTGGTSFTDEGDWLSGDGTRRRVAMQNGVLLDHAGQPYGIACVAIDVTEDRQHRESMEHRVATDPLTGTRNRGAMFEALEELLDPRTGEGCGLLFCDLDDFKGVNDEHGHPVGDRLLIEVAARLRRLAGPEDIVARFGGDEFVILCPHADETTLEALTRRIEDQMSTPLTMPAGPLPIGISIGGAIGRAGDDPDDVITRADGFMYRVKADRRQLRR